MNYGSLFELKRVRSFQDLLACRPVSTTGASGKMVNGKDVEVEHRICGQSIKGYEINAWSTAGGP